MLPVELPPLRDRHDDTPTVAYSLLDEMQSSDRPRGQLIRIESSVFDRLREHDWPGNIRELRNVLERARLRAHVRRTHEATDESIIQAADLIW